MVVRRASQIPEVNYCAFLPEHGVKRFIGGANAMARCTGNVAVVIDNEANSIQVSGKSRELLNTPPLPHDRLGLEDLEKANRFNTFLGYAGWIWRDIFSHSRHFSAIVDLGGETVIPAKRGKLRQNAPLPNKRRTFEVGTETGKSLPPTGLK